MRLFLFYVVIFGLLTINVNSQIKINEIVTSNSSCQDVNANTPDWIEIYNPTTNPINLNNYRIADKNDKNTAWILPNIIINPKSFQLLYASGENKIYDSIYTINTSGNGINRHTNNDGFRFEYMEIEGNFKASVRLHSMRNTHEYSNAGLIIREKLTGGSKYAGLLSIAPERLYAYYKFIYRSIENDYPSREYIGIDREFPYIYLEMERLGDSIFSRIVDSKGYCLIQRQDTVKLNEKLYFGIAVGDSKNQLISCTFSNLYFNGKKIDFNSLNKIDINCAINGNSGYYQEYHTDFKLEKDSGSIYLWNEKGDLADKFNYSTQKCDISYGRIPDGSGNIRYFSNYTPCSSNSETFYQDIAEKPELNLKSGNYAHPISLEFINNNYNDIIFYTLDSSTPNDSSFIFNNVPIEITKNTVVRAIKKRTNSISSEIMNETFFINETTTLPIVALTIDSIDLYNMTDGLFTFYTASYQKHTYLEVFDKELNKVYEKNGKSKIHGHGGAMGEFQHSLRFYGDNVIDYPFWDRVKKYDIDKIILRNGGTAWGGAIIKDEVMSLVTQKITNLEAVDYQPYLMFLNAEFYGIIGIRERFDSELISARNDINEESIDYLEDWEVLKHGNKFDYMEMEKSILALKTEKINDYNSFNLIDSLIDIDNFTKYLAVQFYSSNLDWPYNNRKFWKSYELDNKWRWCIYDMDYSIHQNPYVDNFNILYDETQYDTLINQSRIKSLIFKFLKNTNIRNQFLNISADLLNTHLHTDSMLNVIDITAKLIAPEIPRQQKKWEQAAKNWEYEIEIMRKFVKERPEILIKNYVDFYKLDGLSNVRLSVYPSKAGKIRINSITPANYPWDGVYFQNIPVEISAIPEEGYRFVGWASFKDTDSNAIVLLPDSLQIEAVFEKSANINPLVINEIMYNPDEIECGDWVEIYNKSDKSINLNKWIIKDSEDDHIFTFRTDKYIEPNDFLLVCEDIANFRKVYPKVKKLIGPLGFGLSKKSDQVRIYQPNNKIVDSVSYSTQYPWPPLPNSEKGFSIELKHPDLNNNLGSNWSIANNIIGTPGEINCVYTSIDEKTNKGTILLYPLPAEDYIMIDDAALAESYFQLYDIDGNLINTIIAMENQKIDISNLSSGVYFLMNNKTTYKFIKR